MNYIFYKKKAVLILNSSYLILIAYFNDILAYKKFQYNRIQSTNVKCYTLVTGSPH